MKVVKKEKVGLSSKESNSLEILKIVLNEGHCSRKELAEHLGMSKMTITNLVNHLMDCGYLKEVELSKKQNKTVGPKASGITIQENKIIGIGIHIGETEIVAQIVDIVVGVLEEIRMELQMGDSNTNLINGIKGLINGLLDTNIEYKQNIIAIGIAYDGNLNERSGKIIYSNSPLEKEGIGIKAIIEKKYGIPTYIGHSIISDIMAEIRFGLHSIDSSYMYINIDKSIRSGVITNTMISQGVLAQSCELGHMSIRYDGQPCHCGSRGCYELYGTTAVLVKQTQCHSIEEYLLKLEAREPKAIRVMEDFIQITAAAFTNIINMYRCKYIVLGGDMVKFPTAQIKKIENLVNQKALYNKYYQVKLIPRKLIGENANVGAGIYGIYKAIYDKNYTV